MLEVPRGTGDPELVVCALEDAVLVTDDARPLDDELLDEVDRELELDVVTPPGTLEELDTKIENVEALGERLELVDGADDELEDEVEELHEVLVETGAELEDVVELDDVAGVIDILQLDEDDVDELITLEEVVEAAVEAEVGTELDDIEESDVLGLDHEVEVDDVPNELLDVLVEVMMLVSGPIWLELELVEVE